MGIHLIAGGAMRLVTGMGAPQSAVLLGVTGLVLFAAACVGAFVLGKANGRTPVAEPRRRWIILPHRL